MSTNSPPLNAVALNGLISVLIMVFLHKWVVKN
jgi:hypothetical protein